MRKFLQKLLRPYLTHLASNATAPVKKDVHKSLSRLLRSLKEHPGKKGIVIEADLTTDKYIIFSDHHKGNRDHSDDFTNNEPNYLAALQYYLLNKFTYISLGDCEELWKYIPAEVISKNITSLKAEAKFQEQQKYYRTFGNHDVTWKNKLDVDLWFRNIFTLPLPVWEGLLLKITVDTRLLSIFLTHGHQGDKMSDNNSFSTWLVAHLWRPLQRYLQINVNTPAKDFFLRDRHNIMMHEWCSNKRNLLLVTGHTHKPVFASGRYSDHENNQVDKALSGNDKTRLKPSYFNSGCCCYNDGDITGIEIAGEKISLVKWHWETSGSNRSVLEEVSLQQLAADLR